jgi:hypothetical protein
MSSFLVFDHKPHYCAMTKLLPAQRLMTFSIWHCTYFLAAPLSAGCAVHTCLSSASYTPEFCVDPVRPDVVWMC